MARPGKQTSRKKKAVPRKSVERPFNGGQWSKARFKSFIISALRKASSRWGPKNEVLKLARTGRNQYTCAECGEEKLGRKDVAVDHIDPIVDPAVGFTSFDDWVERCFVEVGGYQVLCSPCHTSKSNTEKEIAKVRRAEEKALAKQE